MEKATESPAKSEQTTQRFFPAEREVKAHGAGTAAGDPQKHYSPGTGQFPKKCYEEYICGFLHGSISYRLVTSLNKLYSINVILNGSKYIYFKCKGSNYSNYKHVSEFLA